MCCFFIINTQVRANIWIFVQTWELRTNKFGLYNRLNIGDRRVVVVCLSSFVPSAITRPFFELQTPDFAWKFVWIVQINYKSTKVQKVQKKYKKVHKYKSTHNSVIFRATDSRFCMEVHMHRPTKWESTKVQKVQKYKSTKRLKNVKKILKIKSTKSTKKLTSSLDTALRSCSHYFVAIM